MKSKKRRMAQSPPKTARLILVSLVCFIAGFLAAALLRRLPQRGAAVPEERTTSTTPSSTRPSTRALATAEKHFQAGFRLLQNEQISEALKEFETAASLDPTDPRPHHGMGQAYQRMVLSDRAEAAYRQALKVDPDFDHSKKELAALLYERGRYSDATRLLKELEDKNPNDTFVWAELAMNAIGLGKPAEAVALLEKYNATVGRQAWGFERLGRAYEAAEEFSKARAAYREALTIDRYFTPAYYALGQLLSAAGKTEESVRLLKTYRELRDLETEAHQLRMALLRDAEDVDTLMRLSQIRVRLGKAAEALPLLERARQLRPNEASIQRIYDKVKKAAADR